MYSSFSKHSACGGLWITFVVRLVVLTMSAQLGSKLGAWEVELLRPCSSNSFSSYVLRLTLFLTQISYSVSYTSCVVLSWSTVFKYIKHTFIKYIEFFYKTARLLPNSIIKSSACFFQRDYGRNTRSGFLFLSTVLLKFNLIYVIDRPFPGWKLFPLRQFLTRKCWGTKLSASNQHSLSASDIE